MEGAGTEEGEEAKMGAMEAGGDIDEKEKLGGEEEEEEEEEEEDHEKELEADGGEGKEVVVTVDNSSQNQTTVVSRLQTQRPPVPIQIVSRDPSTAAAVTASSSAAAAAAFEPTPAPPQVALASLNSRVYTNRLSLLVFLLHLFVAATAVCFFTFKAVQGVVEVGSVTARREKRHLKYWLPPVEAAAALAVALAYLWQKAVRLWPAFLVHFILWFSTGSTFAAGVLLVAFSLPSAVGLGAALILFSIGTSLYACWVTRRTRFTAKVFDRAIAPSAKFRDLNGPTYLMLGVGFLWITLWCFAVVGALNFYYPPLTVIALVLSLAWIAEVMRNVANLTVSRVIALYYLRGMQVNTQFSFQRAISLNLGSACLGSFFLPTIEGLRIIARGLNLLEGEDEFLFSCAHCCLHVMESIFRRGNSWAFVHIAAYGKGFVTASRSTWGLFEREGMEALVDSDITSSLCFLAGVSSGALCTILAGSWTFATHKPFTATASLLAFFIGYLLTRIGMALPHACVACYYVCYAENPRSRLFDSTIPDQLNMIRTGRAGLVSTPRFPRRVSTA